MKFIPNQICKILLRNLQTIIESPILQESVPVLLPYLKDKKEILLLREVVLTVTSSPEVDHYLSIPGQVWLAVFGRHILSNRPSRAPQK